MHCDRLQRFRAEVALVRMAPVEDREAGFEHACARANGRHARGACGRATGVGGWERERERYADRSQRDHGERRGVSGPTTSPPTLKPHVLLQ